MTDYVVFFPKEKLSKAKEMFSMASGIRWQDNVNVSLGTARIHLYSYLKQTLITSCSLSLKSNGIYLDLTERVSWS